MQVIPAEVVDALKTSHISLFRAEVYVNNLLAAATDGIPSFSVVEGAVSVERKAAISRSVKFKVADNDGTVIPFHDNPAFDPAFRSKFHPYRGVRYFSPSLRRLNDYYWPLGKFVITDAAPNEDDDGLTMDVEGNDYSQLISDNRWDQPYNITDGPTYDEAIRRIIVDRAFGFVPLFNFEPSSVICPDMTFEGGPDDDPWEEAQKLAEADGKELFISGSGTFVLRSIPNPTQLGPVWEFNEGKVSTLLNPVSRKISSKDAFNGVMVRGSAPWLTYEVIGVAWDDDPSSPTYFLGPFGKKPDIIDDPMVGTQDQAQSSAEAKLLDHLGVFEDVNFKALVNPALEQGDVVTCFAPAVKLAYASLLEQFDIDFLAKNSMDATVRSHRRLGFNPDDVLNKVKTPGNSPVRILTPDIHDGVTTLAYTAYVVAEGGVTPYNWKLEGSAELAIARYNDTTGVITGTVSVDSDLTLVVTCEDFIGQTRDTATYQVNFGPGPVIDEDKMTDGEVGTAYSFVFTAIGASPFAGPHPFHFTVESGLPSWATFDGVDKVTGTPNTPLDGGLLVHAVDNGGHTSKSVLLSLHIGTNVAVPVVTKTSLAPAHVGEDYSEVLTGEGGVLPYDWTPTLASIPGWASLDITTGEITGNPPNTTGSPFTVHARFQDHNGTLSAVKDLTLTVETAGVPGTPMIAPQRLFDAINGLFYIMPLYACGGYDPAVVDITRGGAYLWDASPLPSGLEIDFVNGYIFGTPDTNGTTNVTITAYLADGTASAPVTLPLVVKAAPSHTWDIAAHCAAWDDSKATSHGNQQAIQAACDANEHFGTDFAITCTKPSVYYIGESATSTHSGTQVNTKVGKWYCWGTMLALAKNQPVNRTTTVGTDGAHHTDAIMLQIKSVGSYRPQIFIGLDGNQANQIATGGPKGRGFAHHGLFVTGCRGADGFLILNNIRGVVSESHISGEAETFVFQSLGSTDATTGDELYIHSSATDQPNSASGSVWQGQAWDSKQWRAIFRCKSWRHAMGHFTGGNGWIMPGSWFDDSYKPINLEAGTKGTNTVQIGDPTYGPDQVVVYRSGIGMNNQGNGGPPFNRGNKLVQTYGLTMVNCDVGINMSGPQLTSDGQPDRIIHTSLRIHADDNDSSARFHPTSGSNCVVLNGYGGVTSREVGAIMTLSSAKAEISAIPGMHVYHGDASDVTGAFVVT